MHPRIILASALLAALAVAPGQVLINEVHGLGSGANPPLPGDYLELWNQSPVPYDLAGHTVSIWAGDAGVPASVTIPCSPNGQSVIPGHCFWVMQEGGPVGGPLTGSLAGLMGMSGLPANWSSSSSMGARITDPLGNCIAYVYLRRSATALPASPPNILAACTWTMGNIGPSGSGLAHIQRLANTDTGSFADWGHDATSNAGTPGAPNTTGAATQTALGSCVASAARPYQVNTPGASLDAGGVLGSSFTVAMTTGTVCGPPLVFQLGSTYPGQGYDVAISLLPPLAGPGPCDSPGTGAFVSSNGQIVAIDFTDPQLSYLNGGVLLSTSAAFPGNHSITALAGVPIPRVTLQLHILAPSHADGAQVSQPVVAEVLNGDLVTLALGDDSSAAVDVSTLCQGPMGGVSYYGTSYTTIQVISNGRILFGAADTDFSPTVTEALADDPFLGFWTDLDPGAAGSGAITVSTMGGLVTVRWNGVPHFGSTSACTFEIAFDPGSGSWTLGALQGVVPNPGGGGGGGSAQFLGLSAGLGGGATDAGPTVFSAGGSGAPAAPTDMLYDFWDGLTSSAPNSIHLVASLQNGLSRIVFTPAGGAYSWAGY
jgi:hypothetical protein